MPEEIVEGMSEVKALSRSIAFQSFPIARTHPTSSSAEIPQIPTDLQPDEAGMASSIKSEIKKKQVPFSKFGVLQLRTSCCTYLSTICVFPLLKNIPERYQ